MNRDEPPENPQLSGLDVTRRDDRTRTLKPLTMALANHLEDWEYQVRREYDTELDDTDDSAGDDAEKSRRRRRGE